MTLGPCTRIAGSLLGLGLLAACGSAPTPSPAKPQPSAVTGGPVAGSTSVMATSCSTPGPTGQDAALRQRGVDALDRGALLEAKTSFEQLLERQPGSFAALALSDAVRASIEAVQRDAANALERIEVFHMPTPPSGHRLVTRLGVRGEPLDVRIEKRSANRVIDQERWFAQHQLALPTIAYDQVPPYVPTELHGQRLSQAIDHGDHRVLIFQRDMVVPLTKAGAVLGVYDLSSYAPRGQTTKWAQASGHTLFVMNANAMYARDSNNDNAHITAIDLKTHEVAWRSQPLVGNAQTFVIDGAHLITGYGFTAEPDALFVLSLATGEVEKRIPLTTAPSILLKHQGRLFVRGYDTDFELALSGSQPAPPLSLPAPSDALLLAPSAVALPTPTDADACRRAQVLSDLDRGERDAALERLSAVGPRYAQHPLMMRLHEEIGAAIRTRRVDMQVRPIALPPAPFEAVLVREGPGEAAPSPRLVKRSAARFHESIEEWLARNEVTDHEIRFQALLGRRPDAPAWLPPQLGLEPVRRVLSHDDHMALLFGGRYVAIVHAAEDEPDGRIGPLRATQVFDFESYKVPPKRRDDVFGQDAELELMWAERRDGVLYATHSTSTYANAVFGKQGYVTALDATSGALLWRSAPLVSRSTFAIVDRWIVTGYGFTDEPDFLYVLDRKTGKTLTRAPLDSAPFTIAAKDHDVYVRTMQQDYRFELR